MNNTYPTSGSVTADVQPKNDSQQCATNTVSSIFRGEMSADWQIRQELADRAIALAQIDVFNDSDYLCVRRVIEILNILRKHINDDVADSLGYQYGEEEDVITVLTDSACDLAEIYLENSCDYYAIVDAVHILAEVRKSLIDSRTCNPKQ